MNNRLSDLLLSFLLIMKIKKIDFLLESVPSTEECCGPNMLRITMEYKWFWQKRSLDNLCNGLTDEA